MKEIRLKVEIAQQILSDLNFPISNILYLKSKVSSLAERVGFEPTVGTSPTTVFETAPFNHSGTSPIASETHAGLYQKLLGMR